MPRKKKNSKRPKKSLVPQNQLQTAVEKVATLLSGQDLSLWVEQHAFYDSDKMRRMAEACATVGKLEKLLRLRFGRLNESIEEAPRNPGNTSQSEIINQFFMYRSGRRSLGILAPVVMFEGERCLTRKTFGFVRAHGTYFPLKYAISGNMKSVKDMPDLLDSGHWASQAMIMADFYQHVFRVDGWDEHHDKVVGAGSAAHVEIILMLWYMCSLLPKADTLVRERITYLHRLRDVRHANGEIVLSRAQCAGCKGFRNILHGLTGVWVDFIVCPSLGESVPERNKQGYLCYPNHGTEKSYAVYSSDAEAKNMGIQVLIKGCDKESGALSSMSTPASTSSNRLGLRTPPTLPKTHRTVPPSKAVVIRSPRKRKPVDDSDGDLYTDPASRRGTNRFGEETTMTKRRTQRTSSKQVTYTPPESYFLDDEDEREPPKQTHRNLKERFQFMPSGRKSPK